jgi:shikimate kinase
MNVILIGYRGTGKSHVANLLAEALRFRVFGLDAELVRRHGHSIPTLVKERGWPAFRDLEQALVAEASSLDRTIIDCGGGVVERRANFAPLRSAGTVIWLRARPDTIAARISGDTERPALLPGQTFTSEIEEVLRRRRPLYAELAHVALDTDLTPPATIARNIVNILPLAEDLAVV